jgi:hypothetical protein
MSRVHALLAVFIAVGPAWVIAQQPQPSLADVARAEEARRKNVGNPSKVYTNNSLRPDFGTVVPAPPTNPLSPDPGAANASGGPAGAATPSQRDQAYWSARIGEARAELDRNQMLADALQSNVNALNTDFVNRDDPAQRAAIDADRKKKLAELDRVRKLIDESKKKISDIEDEARRAGVPAGWLR